MGAILAPTLSPLSIERYKYSSLHNYAAGGNLTNGFFTVLLSLQLLWLLYSFASHISLLFKSKKITKHILLTKVTINAHLTKLINPEFIRHTALAIFRLAIVKNYHNDLKEGRNG